MCIPNARHSSKCLGYVYAQSRSRIQLFATLWTVACQAPPSVGFSKQEYWSGLPLPSPEDLPNPGIEPWSPTLQADALTSEPPGKSSDSKASVYNAGEPGLIPGLGRSPGEGSGNPLQYFRLENPMGRGACRATVHRFAKSRT